MKLYYTPGACSLAPHIAAREAHLDIEIVQVQFAAEGRTAAGGDYYEINPKGAVPALDVGGEVLTENAVILQYLADLAPTALPIPKEGIARWRFLEQLNFIATDLHKGSAPLFDPAVTGEARAALVRTLSGKFNYLQSLLAGKRFLWGETFSILDPYAFTVVGWTAYFKIELTPWPALQDYLARVRARPSVKQAFSEEGLPA